jgi:hypothetical protein
VVLVGLAVTAVAVAGDGAVGRAHYLRQLVFGPAGPHTSRPASPGLSDHVPVIPRGGAARR